MKSTLGTIAVLFLLPVLFGCGQSGPLFIPGNPSTIQPQPEPAETNNVDKEDEEDEEDDKDADRQ